MSKQPFSQIAEALAFVAENFKQQPSLEEIAEKANMSPFHFQRIFSAWAGVSPKNFLQYTNLEYAKTILENQSSIPETAHQLGLSSTSRLHDLFVKLEGMTPAEYRDAGKFLTIYYQWHQTDLGLIFIACTEKGICLIEFVEDYIVPKVKGKQPFPNADWIEKDHAHITMIKSFFDEKFSINKQISLHLLASPFQIKVWKALLEIPKGQLTSYGKIAAQIDQPTASRAVGTAIGSNPIAVLIPCHRVIQQTGVLGGYKWGLARKTALLGHEAIAMKERNNLLDKSTLDIAPFEEEFGISEI